MATNNDVNAAYSAAMLRLSHARDLQKQANKAMREAEKAFKELGELIINGNPFELKQDWTPSGLVAVSDIDPATTVTTEIPITTVYECPYCPHPRHMGLACSGCPCSLPGYAIESAVPSELTAAILAYPLGRIV